MNLTAVAITDMDLLQKIYEVLPPNLQSAIKDAYPDIFEDEVIVQAGNRYLNEDGVEYILATEQGHVALVSLEDGSILNTVKVDNVHHLTTDEIEAVFGDPDCWELAEGVC